ncbi:MAG: ABC transporter ATP-binding protein [Deltaproteobacteria bacterium]|jgi:ABC-2 type transport system ATP-binding protein|nr:ABC transporter ATP-binding protein [Deltaproteobacteria bacterium]
MAVVVLDKINKSFNRNQVLSKLSFQIKENQITGLIGKNGAGKSTCMKIISGLLAPDSGSVIVLDKSLYPHNHLVKKEIGYLPENNPLPDQMRVKHYLEFRGSLKQLRKKPRKNAIDEVVQLLKLDSVYNSFIGNLSTGYRQRTGLAAVFLGWPRLLILDEPVRGLDPVQIISLRKIILEAAKKCTLIISSHGLDELERITERFIFLQNGKIEHDGSLPAGQSLREYFLQSEENN